MITDLDLLLHHLEGELEQGDEVSHLHDGGVAPPPLVAKVCLNQRLVILPQQRTQHRKWSIDMKKKEL